MITIHHLENSRSQRILWLLEELDVDYDVKRYERDKVTNLAPAELKAIHPLGKSPVITDGDKVIAETGAIVEYILKHHAGGKLADNDADAMSYWLHYAEGSLMPPLLIKLVLDRMNERAPFFIKPIIKKATGSVIDAFLGPQIALHFGYVNDHLKKTGWFIGEDLTAADIMMSFPLEAAMTRTDFSQFSAIKDHVDRLQARPAYKAALERGGPYAYA